jgi:co-chaperonin GroES (HSP10)
MFSVQMDKSIDNGEWITDEGVKLNKKDLPALPAYHVLLRPVSVRAKTKGGIYLPDKVKDDVAYLTTIGKVLKLGEIAYKDTTKFPNGPWCSEGDYVCYGKHTGQKFVFKGVKLLLVYDDQIIMKLDNPKDLDTTYNLSN